MSNCKSLSELIISEFSSFNSIGFLGFGKEGKSSFKLISSFFKSKHFIIADSNKDIVIDNDFIVDLNVSVLKGDSCLEVFNAAELVFVSPGVPLFGFDLPDNVVVTSQIDFVFKHFQSKIVAITGTKGKSTTSTLIAELLRTQYKNIPFAGNIGVPAFDIINEIFNSDFTVLEVSSHQLQLVNNSPKYSIFLNIFPEHLDYYPDFQTYFNAKKKIFDFQSSNDFVFVNNDDKLIVNEVDKIKSIKVFYGLNEHENFGVFIKNKNVFFRDFNSNTNLILDKDCFVLKGEHNILNSLSAIALAKLLDVSNDNILSVINNFKGLPHRLESVDNSLDIELINDSISTIPEASLAALEAVKPVYSLILGGFDRGIEYADFISKIHKSDLKLISFYGPAGKRMYDLFVNLSQSQKIIKWFPLFDDSVEFAISNTKKDTKCLLSPAASSYDQFLNFEHRGKRFVQIVSKFGAKK